MPVTISHDSRSCTVCKKTRYGTTMVKYGVRHYACATCWAVKHPRFYLTMEPCWLAQMPLVAFSDAAAFKVALARVRAWRDELDVRSKS